MGKIPAGIYPFNTELLPIIKRFNQLQSKFCLKRVFSYPGSGLIGKDIAYACNQPEIGINVEIFSEKYLEELNTVILVNPMDQSEKTNENLLRISKTALQLGRNVLLCCNHTDSIVDSASELKETYPNFAFSFEGLCSNGDSIGKTMHYKNLDVPVVFVGSLVENPDTLEAICYLYEYFSINEIKCLVFSKTSAGYLFGFRNISSILDSRITTYSSKVEEMNRFANDLITDLTPSVVLVEAPDAIMRFNDITPNSFGIMSYMVSQAFRPDYFICSIPFHLAVPEMIRALSKDFEIRLGTQISAALASNIVVDSAENLQTHEMSSLFVPTNYTLSKISQESFTDETPVFHVLTKSDPSLFLYISNLLGIQLKRS